MKPIIPLAVLFCFLFLVISVKAQHCAPIADSYLSQISIKHTEDRALDIKLEYSKSGGRTKEKYQIYLLAYLEKNENRVPAPLPADLLDKQVVSILHTQAIELKKDGTYEFDLRIGMKELAKKIIELGHLTEKDREAPGGWGFYKDNFRLAVFIPFLEDSTYSVLDSLPEDKHECNYSNERALLFQPLPYSFSIKYGVVGGVLIPKDDDYYIQINQDKRTKASQQEP